VISVFRRSSWNGDSSGIGRRSRSRGAVTVPYASTSP
jgi:hypothetical protein